MPNNNEQTQQLSSTFIKFLAGLLLSATLSSIGAGIIVWRDSSLTKQHIANVDNKYIEKSGRVIKRVDAMAISLATHFADDNAHQLMIQRTHLNFESFMEMLDNAHEDIETLKQQQSVIQQFCCSSLRKNGE